jgi:proteasome assembly chaperone (PAC2) family protein
MDFVTFLDRPQLSHPAFVCAFKGWNDGGEAASMAARFMSEQWQARLFATLDPEEFFDFQVNRPLVRLEEGVSRIIEWPECEFSVAAPGPQDVVLFTAPEPNIRWRTFARTVVDVAGDLGCGMLVTLGAFLTDVPHTRPVPVVGSAQDEQTAGRLGLARSQYQGPTGIVGVLHDASNRLGLPSVSLWAAVPHYLPAAPNPKAALALVHKATKLLGTTIDTAPLARAARRWEQGVARVVEESEELAEYLSRLESAAEAAGLGQEEPGGEENVPSADAIGAEVERFLRERGGDTEGDGEEDKET